MASGGGATSSADMVVHQKNAHGLLMLGYDSADALWANSAKVDVADYEANPSVLSFLYNEGLTAAGGNPFEGVSGYDPDNELGAMETAIAAFGTEALRLSDVGDWSGSLTAAQSYQDSQIPGIDIEKVFNSIIANSIGNALASISSVFNTAKQDSKELSDDVAASAWATADVTLAGMQADSEEATEQIMTAARGSADIAYEKAEVAAMDAADEVITDATVAAEALFDTAKDKYLEVMSNVDINARGDIAIDYETSRGLADTLSADIISDATTAAGILFDLAKNEYADVVPEMVLSTRADISADYSISEGIAEALSDSIISDATIAAGELFDAAKNKYLEIMPNIVANARGDATLDYNTSKELAGTLSADIISDATIAAGALFDEAKDLGDMVSTDTFDVARSAASADHATALDIADSIAAGIVNDANVQAGAMTEESISIADRVAIRRAADVTADATLAFSDVSSDAATLADTLVDGVKSDTGAMRVEAGTEAETIASQLTSAKLAAATAAADSAKTAYGSLETDAAADVLAAFGVAVSQAIDKSESLANSDAAAASSMGIMSTQASGSSAELLLAIAAASATASGTLVTAVSEALLGSEDLAETAANNIYDDTEDDVELAIVAIASNASANVDSLVAKAENVANIDAGSWMDTAEVLAKANSKDRISSTYGSTLSAKAALDEFSNKANTLADSQVAGWVAETEPVSAAAAEGMLDSLNNKTIGDAKIAETVMDSAFDQADADALQAATTNLEMARSNLMADIQTDSKTDAESVADDGLSKAHTAADANIVVANQAAINASTNLATTSESSLRAQAKTAMADIIGAVNPEVSGVILDAASLASAQAAMTLQSAMNAALSCVSEEMLSKVLSSYRKRQLKTHLRSVNRFTGGMADINAVNSSAFIIGLALLESDFEQNVSDFQTNVELTLYREGLGRFSEMFSIVLTEDLKAYHLRFDDYITAYQVSGASYERMLLTEIPMYLQSYTQTVGQYVGLLTGTYGDSMQLGAGMTQIQAGLIQASLGTRAQIISELARLQMTAYTQALVLQVETRLGLMGESVRAGIAFADMQVNTHTSELSTQVDTRVKLFGEVLGAESNLVNSQADLIDAISRMRQGLAEALVRLYGDTYEGLADATTQSASSMTMMGFESSQSSGNSRSAIARDLIKEYLTAYVALIGQGNQTAGVFGALGDEHLKAYAMSLDSYKEIFDGSTGANMAAIEAALSSRVGTQQQSAAVISDAFSKVVDSRLALYERTLAALSGATLGSVETYLDATNKDANTHLGAVDSILGKRLVANAQDSQIRADTHLRTANAYLDNANRDLAVQTDAFSKIVGSRLAANAQDSQIRSDMHSRTAATYLDTLSKDLAINVDAFDKVVGSRLAANVQDAQIRSNTHSKTAATYLDTLNKDLAVKVDAFTKVVGSRLATNMQDSQVRSDVVGRMSGVNLVSLQQDVAARLNTIVGLLNNKIEAYKTDVATNLAAFDKNMGAHLDLLERTLIAHFDGKIKTYLSDSNERSTFVRDGVRTLQAAQGLRLSAKQALMSANLDLEAKKIVAGVDQYDRDLEIDVKSATWDMELFQGAGNVLSAVTGSVVQNAMKPSKSSSAIAGMASGVGMGIALGSVKGATGGAVLGPYGALIGGIVGALAGGVAGYQP